MAAAAAPKEAEPEGEKKKKPILKILLFVVGGIALLGAGFGSAILFIKLTTPKDENPLAIVIEKKGEGAPAEGEHAADAHADAGPKMPHKVTEAEKKAEEAAGAKKGGEGGHGGGEAKPAEGGHGAPAEGGHGAEDPKGKAVPQEEKFVTSYYEFPTPFTTNLKNSRKFIQAGLGIGTQYDASVIENLKKHELAVRSEVLLILADQSEADLVGIENRKKVQDKIREGINMILTERERFGGIENVFFTTLVMQ
jgi:flagellar FliL protein